jgi:hypothetical protein
VTDPAVPDALVMLTLKQVQAWLCCRSPRTVERLIRLGVFRTTHVGNRLRIYRTSVLSYLQEQERSYRPKGSRATLGERTAARYRKAR